MSHSLSNCRPPWPSEQASSTFFLYSLSFLRLPQIRTPYSSTVEYLGLLSSEITPNSTPFLSSNPPQSCQIHLPWHTLEVDKLPNEPDQLQNPKNRDPLLQLSADLIASPPAPPNAHANRWLKPPSPSPTRLQFSARAPATRRPPSPPLLRPYRPSGLPQHTSRAHRRPHPHRHLLLLCHHIGFLTNFQVIGCPLQLVNCVFSRSVANLSLFVTS